MTDTDRRLLAQAILSLMDASLDEHGDIWCNICNKRNEVCECEPAELPGVTRDDRYCATCSKHMDNCECGSWYPEDCWDDEPQIS